MAAQPMDAASLAADLQALRAGTLDGAALAARWRAAAAAWPGLPPRFHTVLDQLLAPLEASALFSEESCSFSRGDAIDGLGQWLQAAQRVAPR